ncbi:hypothetical protein K505DRAFT_325933 [Melanomma pulvis-pyrius CBS 109.77]|uniref:Uncharacterized protein n=1 Tax=Melanomma pulvis-pyrius CBS 109.77 TaxID=1314802 RepID=A0A6A6XAJ1_9PLEO|nr:hypothetical protein K505DRAFT_325933 [Melanomma pulvis-pyrius CBS 109.77]
MSSAYYASGVSTRPSLDSKTTNTSSLSSQTDSLKSMDSTKSTSSLSKAWKAVKKHAKEHHESVNGAYASYYGAGTLVPTSVHGSAVLQSAPRKSDESERTEESGKSVGSVKKSWQAVKQHAKEHHRSVNAAYALYYGPSAVRT